MAALDWLWHVSSSAADSSSWLGLCDAAPLRLVASQPPSTGIGSTVRPLVSSATSRTTPPSPLSSSFASAFGGFGLCTGWFMMISPSSRSVQHLVHSAKAWTTNAVGDDAVGWSLLENACHAFGGGASSSSDSRVSRAGCLILDVMSGTQQYGVVCGSALVVLARVPVMQSQLFNQRLASSRSMRYWIRHSMTCQQPKRQCTESQSARGLRAVIVSTCQHWSQFSCVQPAIREPARHLSAPAHQTPNLAERAAAHALSALRCPLNINTQIFVPYFFTRVLL